MNERVMIEWVENILKPFIETAPENVAPLLVLDPFRWHMMTLVVKNIQQLGVEVEQIPDGCTSLSQLVDIGITKASKMLVCKDWEDWMLDSGINVSVVESPTRQLIVEWVIKAFDTIPMDTVQHSWRHGVYSWFNKIYEYLFLLHLFLNEFLR